MSFGVILKRPEPAAQNLTRFIERADRVHANEASSHRVRKNFQRWQCSITWSKEDLYGALKQNRWSQI